MVKGRCRRGGGEWSAKAPSSTSNPSLQEKWVKDPRFTCRLPSSKPQAQLSAACVVLRHLGLDDARRGESQWICTEQ